MMARAFNPQQLEQYFQPTKRFKSFTDWSSEAQNACTALKNWFQANPNPPPKTEVPVDAEIFGAMKPSLRKYFNDKCAYCDSDFSVVDWGDVDHYRPKLRVAGAKGHRGYYWLAYDMSNLLPACPVCNRGGKRDKFPVDPETERVMLPTGVLTQEHPLLLRPYELTKKEVGRHFQYEFRVAAGRYGRELVPTGYIEGLTPEGEKTIEIFELNRDPLREARRKTQKSAIERLEHASKEQFLDDALDELSNPANPYFSAVLATCLRYFDFLDELRKEKLQKLRE